MVTIVGNGMGAYDFTNVDLDFCKYDKILCDNNFESNANNILKGKYKELKEYILANYEKENLLYIVTGSPLFFSAGTIIASLLPKNQVKLIDNVSSKSYLLSKLFIGESSVGVISLHGKKDIDLNEFLVKKHTFVVCDENSIDILKDALSFFDAKSITTTIGYKLGYEDEVIEEFDLLGTLPSKFDLKAPYVLLIKKNFTDRDVQSFDDEFEKENGMITKRYKRHLSLQNLDLKPNQLLWDIGAGSGSCGIEAFKRYRVKTVFFEKNLKRVEYINNNIKNHFVTCTKFLIGEAQEKFEELEANPHRIFVGGGGSEVIKRLDYLYERLESDGVMLINAITLKHLNEIMSKLESSNIEYEIFSLSLTTYKGKLNLVEPERQLFQIKVVK